MAVKVFELMESLADTANIKATVYMKKVDPQPKYGIKANLKPKTRLNGTINVARTENTTNVRISKGVFGYCSLRYDQKLGAIS